MQFAPARIERADANRQIEHRQHAKEWPGRDCQRLLHRNEKKKRMADERQVETAIEGRRIDSTLRSDSSRGPEAAAQDHYGEPAGHNQCGNQHRDQRRRGPPHGQYHPREQ